MDNNTFKMITLQALFTTYSYVHIYNHLLSSFLYHSVVEFFDMTDWPQGVSLFI